MTDALLNERELSFQRYPLNDTAALLQRPRYADHDRSVCAMSVPTVFTALMCGCASCNNAAAWATVFFRKSAPAP